MKTKYFAINTIQIFEINSNLQHPYMKFSGGNISAWIILCLVSFYRSQKKFFGIVARLWTKLVENYWETIFFKSFQRLFPRQSIKRKKSRCLQRFEGGKISLKTIVITSQKRIDVFFFKQTDKLTIHRNLITVSLKHLAHFTQLVLKSRKFNRLLILLNAKAVLEGDKRRRSRRMKGMHLGWLLGETT